MLIQIMNNKVLNHLVPHLIQVKNIFQKKNYCLDRFVWSPLWPLVSNFYFPWLFPVILFVS